ncbi:CoA-binding protein [Candidatus Micrarchaeota archaeon]|nr:CoA-binding protein [Candidatus Micrarchaeota archaeon]
MKYLLEPQSVVVIGASRDNNSVGYGILKGLTQGCVYPSPYCKAFPGKIYAVNPNAEEILGVKCYSSITKISDNIDLAVISIPAKFVLQAVKECVEKKVKAIIIISAGFAEFNAKGKETQNEISELCKKNNISLLGPNSLGLMNLEKNLNASFALSTPPVGKTVFITQSGALADSVIDWALQESYAFKSIISLGNKAGVNESDFLEWFADDSNAKAITLYLETVSEGRRFFNAIKKCSLKGKKVIVLKGGTSISGLKAASSHTGALASDYAVIKAAVEQAGGIIVETIEELFDIAKAFSMQPKAKGRNTAIITNGGGAGVLSADYCEKLGLNLAELSVKTIKELDSSGKMHPAYSKRNPLDLVGDALPERFEAAINAVLKQENIHSLIVIQTLQTMTDSVNDAWAVIKAKKFKKPIATVFMGGKYSKEAVILLTNNDVPNYNDPLKAVKAIDALSE